MSHLNPPYTLRAASKPNEWHGTHRILKTRNMGAVVLRGGEGGGGVDLDPPLLEAALSGKGLFPDT